MKILLLEDDPHDAELIQPVLVREWPDCQVKVTDTRDSFVAQLTEGGHDIILSDFNMAKFNGLEALQLAREKCPAVPFIFLSGTIGEDRAVEAMRQGATDYVIKDRPKRLIPAMKRALEGAREVRERRATAEQLLRVQRLENIGMLAAGIAHDFNNVLAPVLLAVPLLRDSLKSAQDLAILGSVERSAERGAALVKEILGFAQGVTGEAHLLQSKHLLRELLGVVRQTFPASIEVVQALDPELWPLKINPTQLHQVLLNLCVNARDAMPNGGRLQLRASNIKLDTQRAATIGRVKPGDFLLFEVSDTGTGIPADVVDRIWEPFFTTKEAGRGTGLGLSTVRSIIENYEGAIQLHTRQGRGTTFQVYLPASPGADPTDGRNRADPVPQGHGELILVVDDDAAVRDVTSAILTANGYKVISAADGAEALALYAPRCLEVRAVVTDLSMPYLDGMALIKVLRTINPALRVLAISGLAEQQSRFKKESKSPFLNKPFSRGALLRSIHDLLEADKAAAAHRTSSALRNATK